MTGRDDIEGVPESLLAAKRVEFNPVANGYWMYTVYIDGRATVVGISQSRDRAEHAASLA